MYNKVELPMVTERVTILSDKINENIRLINVLVRQLKKQQTYIRSIESERQDKKQQLKELCKAEENLSKLRSECHQEMLKISEMQALTGFFDFAGKRRLKKQERENDNRREELDTRATLLEEKKEFLARRLSGITPEMEQVHIPNYKLHLTRLYQTLREYKSNADTFECLTGIKLIEIKPEDVLEVDKDKHSLPTIKPHTEEYLPIKVSTKSFKVFTQADESQM